MESNKKENGLNFFQMPLHYPRYTKKDYQDMPEWKLDMLLTEYGLTAMGSLDYKREFAIGAFLWPSENVSLHLNTTVTNKSPGFESCFIESCFGARPLKKKVLAFLSHE